MIGQDRAYTASIVTPNGVRINDTLICDATEVTNSFYKEYLHWNLTHNGENSNEYQQALIDLNGLLVSINISTKNNSIDNNVSKQDYLLLAKYDDYPVVGITLEQAKKYCQWRSDRVLEMLLISRKIIKINRDCKKNKCFSIEKFLTDDKYQDARKRISHYPQYFIADADHWNIIKEEITKKNISVGMINSSKKSNLILNTTGFPYVEQHTYKTNQENVITNILGNVSEMIDSTNKCVGGSINDSTSEILKMEITDCHTPNKSVGFRCLAKWVKVESD